MSKKRSIILISVITAVMVIFVVFATVFRVNSQKVVIKGESDNISLENVIESSGIKKGKSIFFINKEKTVAEIEKNNPYVKVEKIEIKFPNKIEYVISARKEICFEQTEGGFLIFDREFKALRKAEEKPSDLVEIKNLGAGVKIGEFAQDNLIKKCFAFFENTYQISLDNQNYSSVSLTKNEIKQFLNSITLENNGQTVIFKTREGFSVKIKDDEIFEAKVASFVGLLKEDVNAPSLSSAERQSSDVFEFVKSGSGFNLSKIS